MKSMTCFAVSCLIAFVTVGSLVGCSKSVRDVSTATIDKATFYSATEKDDDATRIANKSTEELLTSGFIYLTRKNYNLANMHFAMALKKDPESALAHVGLGRIEQEQGSYEGAKLNYAKALELQPDLIYAHIGSIQVYRLEGQLKKAIEAINRAMQVAPDDVRVLGELAIIYDMMGKENLAEPLYREIVERSPDQASSYNNLGMNHLLRKEYAEAILQFEQALLLNKDDPRIKNNLATAYLLYGEKDRAFTIFKETVGEAAAYNNIGYLLLIQGRLDEAEKALTMALKANPKFYQRAQDNLDRLKQLRSAP